MVQGDASTFTATCAEESATMPTSIVRRSLALIALVTSFSAGSVALGSETDPRELPTQLINVPDADDLNGACSKCRVSSLAAAQTATEDGATVEVYFDDERIGLHGYVEVTVLLSNGTYSVETIEDVDLVNGETMIFELGPRATWSWRQDVEHMWIEVVPTAG